MQNFDGTEIVIGHGYRPRYIKPELKCNRCHQKFPREIMIRNRDKQNYCPECWPKVGKEDLRPNVCIICGCTPDEESPKKPLCAFCGCRTAKHSNVVEGYLALEEDTI